MRTLVFAATVLAVVSPGCGTGARGRLHGTVTWQGQPLTGATVIFLDKENHTHLAKLRAEGRYEVGGVALGPIKVSVQQDPPAVAAKGQQYSSQSKGVVDEKASKAPSPVAAAAGQKRLPELYADADRAGLGFELTGPDQEWSVDLK